MLAYFNFLLQCWTWSAKMAIEQLITEILMRELPKSQVEAERDPGTGKVGERVI